MNRILERPRPVGLRVSCGRETAKYPIVWDFPDMKTRLTDLEFAIWLIFEIDMENCSVTNEQNFTKVSSGGVGGVRTSFLPIPFS